MEKLLPFVLLVVSLLWLPLSVSILPTLLWYPSSWPRSCHLLPLCLHFSSSPALSYTSRGLTSVGCVSQADY